MDILDKTLHRYGFALHWLYPRQKRPIGKDWASAPRASWDELKRSYRDGYNVGVRLGKWSKTPDGYLHVIDLDINDPECADEAWAALEGLFPDTPLDTFPSVISGSGGESRHIYFVTDEPFASKKLDYSKGNMIVGDKKKRQWEIELFGTRKQVAMPPSIHPDTGKRYRWEREYDTLGPPPLIPADIITDLLGHDLEIVSETDQLGVTYQEVEDYLKELDLDYWCEDRDGWIKVGMALHHEFGGAKDAFDVWCDFARQSKKFDLRTHKHQWRSFKDRSSNPVTFRTIIDAANEAHWQRVRDSLPDMFDDLPEEEEGTLSDDELLDLFEDLPPLSALNNSEPHPNLGETPKNLHKELADYPADLLTVPGRLADVVRIHNESAPKTQPQLAVHCALAFGSIICGRNYCTDYRNFTSLYFLSIAKTSAGKEHSKTVAETLLKQIGELDALKGDDGYASRAGVHGALVKRPRHLSVVDEIGKYMMSARNSGNSNVEEAQTALMEQWGRNDSFFQGQSYSIRGMTKEQAAAQATSEKIERPAVTMMAFSTPNTWWKSLSMADLASGFLNRLLPVESLVGRQKINRRRKPIEMTERLQAWCNRHAWPTKPHSDDMDDIRAHMEIHHPSAPIIISFDDDAVTMIEQAEIEVMRLQDSYEKFGFDELFGRTLEMAMKVSLIVALSCDQKMVRACDFQWAYRYVMYHFDRFAEIASKQIGISEVEEIADSLFEAVKKSGKSGLSVREFVLRSRPFKSLANERDRNNVLSRLTSDYPVVLAKRKSRRGPSANVYVLLKHAH